jgi:hypothetical protein
MKEVHPNWPPTLISSLGFINVAGYGLAFGSIGQALLLAPRFPKLPFWMIYLLLLTPWLIIHAASFCSVAPCGPRRFHQILTVAVSWYALNTLLAELLHVSRSSIPPPKYPAAIPHLIICGGAISFAVLIRAVIEIRRYELSLG